MSSTYTIKNVTADLASLLQLTKIYTADTDGFWVDSFDGSKFMYSVDKKTDEPKPVLIFQDNLPKGDYHFFNPFAEGFGQASPSSELFFKMIRIAFNLNFLNVVKYVIEQAWASKQDPSIVMTSPIIRMGSVHVEKKRTLVDYVDEDFVAEAAKLIDRLGDECVFVAYNARQATAVVRCSVLTDPTWDEKFGKDIRKKSLTAFRAVIMGVLGISAPSDLAGFSVKYDPDLKSSAKLHTVLSAYYKLYAKFNDALAESASVDGVPDERAEIDLTELSNVIDRLPLAYAIAKHMVQPTPPRQKVTSTQTTEVSPTKFSSDPRDRFKAPELTSSGFFQSNTGSFVAPQPQNRFQAPVVGGPAADPMSPAYAYSTNSSMMGNGFGVSPVGFGGVGVSPMQPTFSPNSHLDFSPPSNFGSPGTRSGRF